MYLLCLNFKLETILVFFHFLRHIIKVHRLIDLNLNFFAPVFGIENYPDSYLFFLFVRLVGIGFLTLDWPVTEGGFVCQNPDFCDISFFATEMTH